MIMSCHRAQLNNVAQLPAGSDAMDIEPAYIARRTITALPFLDIRLDTGLPMAQSNSKTTTAAHWPSNNKSKVNARS